MTALHTVKMDMNQTKRQARLAGLLYFLASVPAPFGLIYVPNKLIVLNDPTATANHIRASESLLRFGIGCELLGSIIFIFVAVALYRLFKAVNETHALAMMILILVSIPISLLSVVNEIVASIVVSGANFLSVFDTLQLNVLTYILMRLHGRAIVVAEIFWGLWLFPFGILVIRSGFIPRFLGYLLFLAGLSYLATSVTFLLLPAYGDVVDKFASPLTVCELPIIVWLLIWGAKDQRDRGPVLATA
ncbi:MAG TPA: DUF4386 domain-containing protein [Chthoniobacterales bacterium]|nr:DUF4386 domain-containing protein [Chthoniobacterales bacterium]